MKDLNCIYILTKELQRNKGILAGLDRERGKPELVSKYKAIVEKQQNDIIKKKISLEQYINGIEDDEIRLIAKLRFIDLKSWTKIGDILYYDRSVVYRKLQSYLDLHKKHSKTGL